MPRLKIYDGGELPRDVARIAKAVCADYDRRSRAIRAGIKNVRVRREYERLNAAVDAALLEIEEPMIRKAILRDMVERRGYERSEAQPFICANSYYLRRRHVLYHVARAIALI